MNCKHQNTRMELTPKLIHKGKLVCSDCGRWLKWVPADENEGIRTSTSKYTIQGIRIYHKFENDFCFLCLRTKEQLGEKETLTIDHIIPIREQGKDELENLVILCSACHKLRHWTELYLNKPFKKQELIA